MSTGDQPVGMDSDAVVNLASNLRDSADAVKRQVQGVADNMIAPTDTGFAYKKTQGDAIHNGLLTVQQWLKDWAEATQLTGDAIGQNAISVTTVDKVNSENTEQAAS
ncbi:hypothetical protein [Nocardia sp. CA-290969]|uniref:hypothetical protein n=1 Tax=Nocardia sp. CA-290969 TaxID=3239986 RepID=UPI003D8D5583